MTDSTETRKSPCCNVEEWDQDCDECEASGQVDGGECTGCDGAGYIEGWRECSKCGDTYEEQESL